MKKLRQSTVEPVIGTLVNFLEMRRVNTRGIKLAKKCLLMAAVCYNLKRLFKWTSENIKNQAKRFISSFFCCSSSWCSTEGNTA